MNDTPNPNPSQAPGESLSEGTANPESSSQQEHCILEPLRSAVNEGAHRAKAAADRAIPKVKAAVSGATYWVGYGLSFAAVFSYTIVTELAPEVLKAGGRDGADAGKRTAENLASKLKAPPNPQNVTVSPGTDASGPSPQPGIASSFM